MVEEKSRKELLEEPDPFIIFVGRVMTFAKKYQQQIVMAVMAVFIVVVAVSGMVYFKRQAEDNHEANDSRDAAESPRMLENRLIRGT